jgi:hypothetical protein
LANAIARIASVHSARRSRPDAGGGMGVSNSHAEPMATIALRREPSN